MQRRERKEGPLETSFGYSSDINLSYHFKKSPMFGFESLVSKEIIESFGEKKVSVMVFNQLLFFGTKVSKFPLKCLKNMFFSSEDLNRIYY